MNRAFLREVVFTILKNHPPECVFEENAEEKIIAEVDEMTCEATTKEELVDILEKAVRRREIYCPHEGIGV